MELWLDPVLFPCTLPRSGLAKAVGGNQGLQATLQGKYSQSWMFLLALDSLSNSVVPGAHMMVPHFLHEPGVGCGAWGNLHGEAGCITASGSPHGTI